MTGPEDLGPQVLLPGGFLEVFEFLASVGVKQVEFAGLGQNAANPGGTTPNLGSVANPANLYANRAAYLDYIRVLRGFLDDTGLEAIGNHGYIPASWPGPGSPSTGGAPAGTMNQYEQDRFQLELEAAADPRHAVHRHGQRPDQRRQPQQGGMGPGRGEVDGAEQPGVVVGALGLPAQPQPGLQLPAGRADGDRHRGPADRRSDLAAPWCRGESGIRLMEYYLQTTDPGLCFIELDIYWAHVAQHQHRWYYDWSGKRQELVFDPTAYTAANTNRIPLYHAKDGDRTAQEPGVGDGYTMVPFQDPRSDIDYQDFFQGQGARGYHNPNYEQDNAPGGAADPGRSLRYSRWSAEQMNALRG